MKPAPRDWPRLSVSYFYKDPAKAIDWLRDAFGFVVRAKVEGEGGEIVHSELTYGEGLVMVGGLEGHGPGPKRVSPLDNGGQVTGAAMFFVDDVDAHCEHARKHGAVIVREPITSDYGEEWFQDRSYGCSDLEGHFWWFVQRLRDAPTKK